MLYNEAVSRCKLNAAAQQTKGATMATAEVVCTNITSLEEVVAKENGKLVTGKQILEEFFEHFSVQELPEELSFHQVKGILPTAIKWWEIKVILQSYFEDDPQLLDWEEMYHVNRLGIFRHIRRVGLHFA